jgi:integrase
MAGQGSVFRRASDGMVIAQKSIGGRANRRYISRSGKTEAIAKRRLKDALAALDAAPNPTTLSLGAYLRSWLDETAAPNVSPNTLRGYRAMLTHMAPIAEIPLAKVSAQDLERCLNGMTTHRRGAKSSAPASAKTVRNVQVALRLAFAQAKDRGHIARDVAHDVKLRRVPRRRQEPMTIEAARAILKAIAGDRYEAAYALGFVALRSGEIRGLSLSDVAKDGSTVRIRHGLQGSGKRSKLAPTKTDSSDSTVPLPPFVADRLLAHIERLKSERPVASIDGDGLVFVSRLGLGVNGSWLTKHFKQLLEAAGLPTIRLHDLRHGTMDLLAAAGAHPKVAQELARHASFGITMDRYTHVSAGQQREGVDLLQRAIVE